MTELETQIWNIVHNWCDAQSKELPDQNRRYLMDEMKALVLSHISGSLPSLEDATKVAVRISAEAIKPPFDAKEQAIFIAGFQECIKWLNVVFSNDH